jgi:hypothetical protein
MSLTPEVLARVSKTVERQSFFRHIPPLVLDDGFRVERVPPCTCRLHQTKAAGIVTLLEKRLSRTCCGEPYAL